MSRRGVSGWMFLVVPAHPGSPGQRAVKRSCVCVCVCVCVSTQTLLFYYDCFPAVPRLVQRISVVSLPRSPSDAEQPNHSVIFAQLDQHTGLTTPLILENKLLLIEVRPTALA